jgi:DNA-binding GntR family transcriptional regulator
VRAGSGPRATSAPSADGALGVSLYQRLKGDILSGQLKPGQIVSERGLVERLGGSRTPMRYALARLQEQGLITGEGRRGYSVTPVGLQDVAEVVLLRRVLEGTAAELAARRITEDELVAIERLAQLVFTPDDADGFARFVRINRDFHLAIARASGNARLVRAIAGLLDDMRRVITVTVSRSYDLKAMQREHQAIAAALRRRDPAAAKRAVGTALGAGGQRIVRALNLRDSAPGRHPRPKRPRRKERVNAAKYDQA